jgi:hypothetical protein
MIKITILGLLALGVLSAIREDLVHLVPVNQI